MTMPNEELIAALTQTNQFHESADICTADVIAVLQAQAERITELEGECEVERLRLAACGVAALGYFDGCKDEYKSASLDDVLRLNKRCADLRAELGDLPEAQAEMLSEIKQLRAQLAETEKLVVSRFDEEEVPQFTQGLALHELVEPVTAEHCNYFVSEIVRLRAQLEQIAATEPVAKLKPCKEGWFIDLDNPPPLTGETIEVFTRPMPAQPIIGLQDVHDAVTADPTLADCAQDVTEFDESQFKSVEDLIAHLNKLNSYRDRTLEALSKYKGAK